MKTPFSVIKENLNDRKSIFIFPSEISAEMGMKSALNYGRVAVSKHRFLSWDRFKEQHLSINEEERRPVSKLDMLLFCLDMAQKNKKSPFLQTVIKPEFASQGSSMIPVLEQAMKSLSLLEEGFGDLASLSLKNDLKVLNGVFHNFKSAYKLYEIENPTSISIDDGFHYNILFSELILDFDEYKELLQTQKSVSIIDFSNSKKLKTKLDFYENDKEEIKSLFSKLQQIYKNENKQPSVIITVADNSLLPLLKYYESLYGLSLDYRLGKKLSDYNEIQFFSLMREAVGNNFQFSSFSDFLLNQSPPWKKDISVYHNIILRAASESFVLEDSYNWLQSIWSNEDISEDYFKKLFGLLRRIVNAPNFLILNASIQTLLTQYLDEDQLLGPARFHFQASLDKLKELVAKFDQFRTIKCDSPFSLWMHYLSSSQYVEKSTKLGIPVYDYRVSAGTNPDYHFVIGLNQSSSTVLKETIPLISEQQKELWSRSSSIKLTTEFSSSFVEVYKQSGKNVILSASSQTLSGPQTPPSSFVISDSVNYITQEYDDPILLERNAIKEDKSVPQLSNTLLDGFNQYKSNDEKVNSINQTNYTLNKIENEEMVSLFKEKWMKEEEISFSSSFLDNFAKCRWRALIDRVIRKSYPKESNVSDGAYEGQLIHSLFEFVYEVFKEKQLALNSENYNELMDIAQIKFEEFFINEEKKSYKPKPIDAHWESLKKEALKSLIKLINDEIKLFNGNRVDDLEAKLQIEKEDILFQGRIDRISRKGMNAKIIDYKRNLSFTKIDIDDSNLLSSYQMPFYFILAQQSRKSDQETLSLYYYDVKKRGFVAVYDNSVEKAWLSDEKLELVIQKTYEFIKSTKNDIEKGNFTISKEPDCKYCNYKSLCRIDYALTKLETKIGGKK